MKPLPIIILIVTFLGLSGTGFLFKENRSLTSENASLQKQLSQVEKDLIYYKSTELGKEVELLNLKLQNAERELTETKESLSSTEESLKKLQSGAGQISAAANILLLMLETTHGADCFSDANKEKTRQALLAFNDSAWLSLWDKFINDAKREQCTLSPSLLKEALDYGFKKIDLLAR